MPDSMFHVHHQISGFQILEIRSENRGSVPARTRCSRSFRHICKDVRLDKDFELELPARKAGRQPPLADAHTLLERLSKSFCLQQGDIVLPADINQPTGGTAGSGHENAAMSLLRTRFHILNQIFEAAMVLAGREKIKMKTFRGILPKTKGLHQRRSPFFGLQKDRSQVEKELTGSQNQVPGLEPFLVAGLKRTRHLIRSIKEGIRVGDNNRDV